MRTLLNYSNYLNNVTFSLAKDGFKNIFTDESAIYSELKRVKTASIDPLDYKINLFGFKTRMFSEDIICFLSKCTDTPDLEKLSRNAILLFDLGNEYATMAENDYHRKHRLVMPVFISDDAPFSEEVTGYVQKTPPMKRTIVIGATSFTRVGAPILVDLREGRVYFYPKRPLVGWNLFRIMDKFATKYFQPVMV